MYNVFQTEEERKRDSLVYEKFSMTLHGVKKSCFTQVNMLLMWFLSEFNECHESHALQEGNCINHALLMKVLL